MHLKIKQSETAVSSLQIKFPKLLFLFELCCVNIRHVFCVFIFSCTDETDLRAVLN